MCFTVPLFVPPPCLLFEGRYSCPHVIEFEVSIPLCHPSILVPEQVPNGVKEATPLTGKNRFSGE